MGALVRRIASVLVVAAAALPGMAGDEERPAPKPDAKAKAADSRAPEPAPEPPRVALVRPAPRTLDEALRRLGAIKVTVQFKDAKFDEVVQFIGRVAGFNVIVAPALQPQVEGIAPVTMQLRDVSLRQLADLLTQFTKTAVKFEDGLFQFTTPKDARGKPVLRIYGIGELTMPLHNFPGPDLNLRPAKAEFEEEKESDAPTAFSDPQKIVEMIQKLCGEDTWSDEGVSISADETKLIVRTYPEVHRQIARIITLLLATR